jgi:hypothetical protein
MRLVDSLVVVLGVGLVACNTPSSPAQARRARTVRINPLIGCSSATVSVSPCNPMRSVPKNSNDTISFTIKNIGTGFGTTPYTATCLGDGTIVTSCSPSDSSFGLMRNQTIKIKYTYTTSNTVGTGSFEEDVTNDRVDDGTGSIAQITTH